MADAPVKLVVDCSVPDRDTEQRLTADQVHSVLDARAAGTLTSDAAATKLAELADRAAAAANIPDRIQVVALTDEEIAQRDKDAAEPPPPPPAPANLRVLEALNALDPATATVADVLAAIKPALE